MQLDSQPHDRPGRWMRRLALAFLAASLVLLLGLTLLFVWEMFARIFRLA